MLSKKDKIITFLVVGIAEVILLPVSNTLTTSLSYGFVLSAMFILGSLMFVSTYAYSFIE